MKNKILDILGPNELNICITTLENLFLKLNTILHSIKQNEVLNKSDINNKITDIRSELIIIFKNFGTESFSDLLSIIINENYINYFRIRIKRKPVTCLLSTLALPPVGLGSLKLLESHKAP